jgi:steroid 5-alpha reductase family enzyme
LLFTLPAVAAVTPVSQPLGIWDFVLAMMMLALIVFETIADQQQYNFQKAKHQNIAAGKDLNYEQQDGFCKTGLWSLVRHPNYAAEQGIWLLFYGFSMVASGQWINWSLMGAMLLLLLFQGSSDFSEKISAGKYPAYTAYQKRVGRFLPKLFAK